MDGDDHFLADDGVSDIIYGGTHDKGDVAYVDAGPNGETLIHGVEFIVPR